MIYLAGDTIRQVHQDAIERYGGVMGEHEPGLIDYMAEKPSQVLFGVELYPSIFQKAACYWFGFATTQYFVDGNKRTAYICADVFLRLNGYLLRIGEEELYHLALDVAKRSIDETDLAKFLEMRCERLR